MPHNMTNYTETRCTYKQRSCRLLGSVRSRVCVSDNNNMYGRTRLTDVNSACTHDNSRSVESSIAVVYSLFEAAIPCGVIVILTTFLL